MEGLRRAHDGDPAGTVDGGAYGGLREPGNDGIRTAGDRSVRPVSSSIRARNVQLPIIPTVAGWIAETPGTISLGQGVAYYGPPPEALRAAARFLESPGGHSYKPDAGIPELREAFQEKLLRENGIDAPFERRIIVTAGANQAFANAVLAVCDPGDEVVLLAPYYFNHEMAVALAGCVPVCVQTDANYLPRLGAIEAAVTPRTRAVVTVSPNNPAGVVYSREVLSEINRFCERRGIYHISDEAYEYFTYDGAEHFSPGSPGGDGHTISIYSLSKAYGMASWRIGFLVAPEHIFDDLIKIQDTIIVCAPAVSQAAALEALRIGRGYCESHLEVIGKIRRRVRERLEEVPELLAVPESRGAFYFLAKVNTSMDDLSLAERLVRDHKVAAIPGRTFGIEEGCCLRIAYGSLTPETAEAGIDRLIDGLRAILARISHHGS
ncbi:MAG: pyridoxal phosphate-dependent aminotransferase [Deltaproteobacteria bacterium]|nr:pyridoxal phosphate-dependent aminotransferase [Deltaproteobacteria bacterium]